MGKRHGSRAVERAIEAASEAVVLQDLEATFVPAVEEALDGSGSLLFEFGDNGRPRGVSGSLARHIASYNATLFGADPLQAALRRADPDSSTVLLEDVLGADELHASPAFHEFYRPLGVEQLMGVWPTKQRFGAAGMVGLVIGRPASARRFGARERRIFERVLPSFRAAVLRDRRLREREREQASAALALDTIVPRPVFVLDVRGSIRWMSRKARASLRDEVGLDRKLAEAARCAVRTAMDSELAIPIRGRIYEGQLRLERFSDGERAVVIALRDDRATQDEVLASARSRGLTNAEAAVLACVARGLDNRSIADELSVTESTVKTHLRQITSKLGVASRTQAALLVHGLLR